MRKYFKILAPVVAMMVLGSCVDDFTDSNPPEQLDAPALRVSAASSGNQTVVAVPANRFQNDFDAYARYGTSAEFTVSVVRAAGKIGTITVEPSVPEFGTVTVNEASVAAIQGQESGDFTFTFTPAPGLSPDVDRGLNIDITVSDQQTDENNESAPKTTQLTVAMNIVNCISTGITPGYWTVVSASGNLDGGETYNLDSLKKYLEVNNVFLEVDELRPGAYSIDEVTGGVWRAFYSGRANPKLQVELCGTTISGKPGAVTTGLNTTAQRKFTIDGTLNSDGTITVNWSYVREVGPAPPAPAASGTYTIAPF